MIDESRALRAYTDTLAVEYDEDTDLLRIVTLGGSYVVDERDKAHVCPDREYNDVAVCKHIAAAAATTGSLDVPTGWLVAEDLDERPVAADGGVDPEQAARVGADVARESVAFDGVPDWPVYEAVLAACEETVARTARKEADA